MANCLNEYKEWIALNKKFDDWLEALLSLLLLLAVGCVGMLLRGEELSLSILHCFLRLPGQL